ncbi:histidinol-phosphatase HisJ [Amphibacillus sp. Q70]|uniref:histidinol-phosphatase HisJ n=1 Tax=Amphibacillus sp. Q70 TaxID=3453416 RepID=UPI003F83AFC0
MNFFGDYHIHTPFCPHGSNDVWEQYILKAIGLGMKEISFTEHAPLPQSFTDPVPEQNSAMEWGRLQSYLDQGNDLKAKYQDQIKINIGFEVDFIEGFESEIKGFLDQYGEYMDDAILSVHMLRTTKGEYVCIDYSAELFSNIIADFGSIEAVYQAYYHTIKLALEANLGDYKPKRIGHLTLIEKFAKKFPADFDPLKDMDQLLHLIHQKNYSLDLNTAGLYKPDCLSIYPNEIITKRASELGIPLIPGSDSHEAATIARGFTQIRQYLS